MAHAGPVHGGHVDLLAFYPSGGVLFSGWVTHAARASMQDGEFVARFGAATVTGFGMTSYYPRPGLEEIGVGMLLHLECSARPEAAFGGFSAAADMRLEVTATRETRELEPAAMAVTLGPLVRDAEPGLPDDLLRQLMPPAPAAGVAVVAPERGLLHVDEAIFVPPQGVAVIGWCLGLESEVLTLHAGGVATSFDLADAVRLARPGVIEGIGAARGLETLRCGFVAYVPTGIFPGEALSIGFEEAGRTRMVEVPRPVLQGWPAIRRLLADCDMQFADTLPALSVLAPAVAGVHAAFLGGDRGYDVVCFGTPPVDPFATIVVPLHGNLDFAEVQCALFASDPGLAGCEILYVLDDPAARREAENLFASIHARFGRPMSLLVHRRTLGFAPACNTGIAAARGALLCLLNSDVFPDAPGWLPALGARLEADPTLGVVGPVLRHEDGSLQHGGMLFRPIARHGGLYFGDHPGLGLRVEVAAGLRRWPAITGACLVMATEQARAMGGLDEAYALGDFEDSDLCLRLAALGLGAAVDGAVGMVHPGRRSQGSTGERWRMNLVLCNAWQLDRRFRGAIEALAGGGA